jgi:hypothetical protein
MIWRPPGETSDTRRAQACECVVKGDIRFAPGIVFSTTPLRCGTGRIARRKARSLTERGSQCAFAERGGGFGPAGLQVESVIVHRCEVGRVGDEFSALFGAQLL